MKLDSKYFDRIRTRRKGSRKQQPRPPPVHWDGCDRPGVHRAPVGRNAEGQFLPLLLRACEGINKGYNYFSGLSDSEIARYQKEAITGPSPHLDDRRQQGLARGAGACDHALGTAGRYQRIKDPFGFVREGQAVHRGPNRPSGA